jgi:hypothetical protein
MNRLRRCDVTGHVPVQNLTMKTAIDIHTLSIPYNILYLRSRVAPSSSGIFKGDPSNES